MKTFLKFVVISSILFALLSVFCVDELNSPPPLSPEKITITILDPDAKKEGMPFKTGEQVLRKISITNPHTVDTLIVDYGEPNNPNNIDRMYSPSTSSKEYIYPSKIIYQEVGKKTITATLKFKKSFNFTDKSTTGSIEIGVEPKISDKLINCSIDQVFIGSTCTLSVDVTEYGNMAYKWEKNNTVIPGANRKKYIINPISNSNAGSYRCYAKNEWGSDTSKEYTLSITANPKPKITLQPQNQQVTTGKSVTFTCIAIPDNVKYQWFRNGSEIVNETKSTCTVQSASQEDDNAKFKCKVFNDFGSCETIEVLLKVFGSEQRPEITRQPSHLTVVKGDRALFSLDANGTNLVFLWQKNGADISNATSKILQTEPVTEADNGARFRCKVTNSAGAETSSEAILTVQGTEDNIKPQIIQEPSDIEVTEGGDASFQVVVNGKNLKYQWKCNNNDINGEINDKCRISGAKKSDNGSKYKCIISNAIGSVTSREANLKIVDKVEKIVITKQPENQTVKKGEAAKFSVVVSGTNPTYQWLRNSSPIFLDANLSTYTTQATEKIDNEAKYCCIIKNNTGEVKSEEAKLTVQWPPKITRQPENKEIKEGNSVSFSIDVEDGNPIATKYAWKDNSGNIVSVEKLCTIQAKKEDNGKTYQCTASNDVDKEESRSATLSVFYIEITQQPQSPGTVIIGKNFELRIEANGNPEPQYEWKRDGTNVGTSKTLSIPQATLNDNGNYVCRVYNNKNCEITSNNINILVKDEPPQIIQQPQNQTVTLGSTAQFLIQATGTNLKYQWNGVNGVGNSSKISVNASNKNMDNAQISCTVSNSAGSVTSKSVTLFVQWPPDRPSISISPNNTTIESGASATFSASLNEKGNPQGQGSWFKGQQSLGTTQITYPINSASESHSGTYYYKIYWNNQYFSSAGITLTVKKKNSPPVWTQIGDQQLSVNTGANTKTINLSNYCRDPDMDPITYDVSFNNSSVIGSISGTSLLLEAKESGSSTCKVTATDNKNSPVSTNFDISVAVIPPEQIQKK